MIISIQKWWQFYNEAAQATQPEWFIGWPMWSGFPTPTLNHNEGGGSKTFASVYGKPTQYWDDPKLGEKDMWDNTEFLKKAHELLPQILKYLEKGGKTKNCLNLFELKTMYLRTRPLRRWFPKVINNGSKKPLFSVCALNESDKTFMIVCVENSEGYSCLPRYMSILHNYWPSLVKMVEGKQESIPKYGKWFEEMKRKNMVEVYSKLHEYRKNRHGIKNQAKGKK